MRNICLYFQIHQPYRFRRYRFFDIGSDHYYYDDYANKSVMNRIANECYLPANKVMLDLIKEHGSNFKVAFSITGIALEQFERYAPEVLVSFKELAATGCVEFLSETYAHSLSVFKNKDEFKEQVELHRKKIQELFGQTPTVFRNTELVYNDDIGEVVADMGFKAMLTEGAKHVLAWKSPNFLYYGVKNKKLKILLKNYKLSDDIGFRFSDHSWEHWPLSAEKFTGWLNMMPEKEEIVNIFMDYETFGEHQKVESGIFDFLAALPKQVSQNTNYKFITPSEAADNLQPIAPLNVPYPISWADEERDLTAWLGNELQDEAYNKLYENYELVKQVNDRELTHDWYNLQASDHFYYMCTKFFSDGALHGYFSPYDSPYDAFINYMNVLSDFKLRLERAASALPEEVREDNVDELVAKYEEALKLLKSKQQQQVSGIVTVAKTAPKKRATTSRKAASSTKETEPSKTVRKATKPASSKTAGGTKAKTTTKKKTTTKGKTNETSKSGAKA